MNTNLLTLLVHLSFYNKHVSKINNVGIVKISNILKGFLHEPLILKYPKIRMIVFEGLIIFLYVL